MNEALLQQLIDAGTPPLLVAKVAAELAALATRAEAVAEIVEKRRAKDRERKRVPRNSTESTESAEITPSLSLPPDPQPNPTPASDISIPRAKGPYPMPEGVDPDHWRDFLANRKRKNLSNTPTAHKRLMDDLARFSDAEWPPGRLIEHAAARGWAGIYDPREDQSHVRLQRQSRPGETPGIGRTVAAAQSVIADIRAARARTG